MTTTPPPPSAGVPAPRGEVGLLVALTALTHLPALAGGFLWDDNLWLADSPLTTSSDGWVRAWTTGERFDWVPLTSSAFWIAWRVFGDVPFGYHALNLALHALSAVALLRVLQALRLPGAWIAAAAWAVHPVNVATAAWIAELKNTLSFPLHALAALAWIRSWERPSARLRAGAAALHAASLLAKSAGVGLPVGLWLLAWARGRSPRREARDLAPLLAISLAVAAVTWRFQATGAIGTATTRDLGIAERVAGAGAAVWFYLGKALVPRDLAIVYPRDVVATGGAVAWLGTIALVLVLGALLAAAPRIGRAPFAAFAGYVVMLAPVLGFVETYYFRWSPVADHWQYHALPWALAPPAAALATLAARARPGAAGRVVAAAWPVVLGALTFAQARAYHDPRTFWSKVLAHDPASALAHAELGVQLAREGDAAGAETHLREAMARDPSDGFAPNNLGRVLEAQERREEAAEAYRLAAERAPRLVSARANRGRVLAALGDVEGALAELRAAADADRRFAEPRWHLATLFLQSGEEDSARARLEEVVALAPGAAEAHRALARLLVRRGDLDAAAARMRDVLRLLPDDPEAPAVLAAIERARGEKAAAPAP